MCHCRTMKQKSLRDPLSEFIFQYFHLYSHSIKVYRCFLMKLFSNNTPLLPLPRILVPSMWPQSICNSCTFSIWNLDRCLVIRNERLSWKLTDRTTSNLNVHASAGVHTHTHVRLLHPFTIIYYSSGCSQFVLPSQG
jgi:hypothetical protein